MPTARPMNKKRTAKLAVATPKISFIQSVGSTSANVPIAVWTADGARRPTTTRTPIITAIILKLCLNAEPITKPMIKPKPTAPSESIVLESKLNPRIEMSGSINTSLPLVALYIFVCFLFPFLRFAEKAYY